jgi:molybdopterin converting factor small subunit
VAHLRLFGPAREAAGTAGITLPGQNVAEIIAAAQARFGEAFTQVVAISNIWVNGDPAQPEDPVHDGDEVAVIPPVSGG